MLIFFLYICILVSYTAWYLDSEDLTSWSFNPLIRGVVLWVLFVAIPYGLLIGAS